jgi:hypothetical protein
VTRTVEDLGAEIERRWVQLGAPPTDDEMKVVDLPQQVTAGQLLLGIGREGSRLLVPLAGDAHRSFKPERKSRGVNLLVRSIEQEGGNRWFLDVVCLRSELRWLFSSFIADVLLRFERRPEVEPASIVKTCYSAWRALFAGAGPRMTVKQLAGLYGELNILGRLLSLSESATSRWKGPLGEAHDFVGPGLDIEVKTTLSDEDDVVHIHGLEQLNAQDGCELYLAHLRVETPSSDGESLGELVSRLEATDRSGKLQGLLVAAGYEDAERHAYSEVTFRLLEERWFAVDDSFPRLTSSTFAAGAVPAGLGNFRYTLDLGAVTVPPTASSAVSEILAGVVA